MKTICQRKNSNLRTRKRGCRRGGKRLKTERSARQKDFQAAQALEAHWKLWEQKGKEAADLEGKAALFDQKRQRIDVLRKAEVLAEPCRHLDELEREGKATAAAADKAHEASQQAAKD